MEYYLPIVFKLIHDCYNKILETLKHNIQWLNLRCPCQMCDMEILYIQTISSDLIKDMTLDTFK